jgi:ribosomal protein S18 acetylase RimI-like enzyme
MQQIIVEKVEQDPRLLLAGLVEESSAQGFGALRRVVSDWAGGICRFGAEGEGLFVALQDGRVVGVCALDIAPDGVDKGIGRLRDMYVSATCRRSGIGKSLVRRLVTEASAYFTALELRADTPGAALFYEALGFRPTPQAVDSTHRLDLRPAVAEVPRA